jgi:uncharacterized membrane protein
MIASGWTGASGSALAAFLASLVEFVEALTIVLAVGVTRGWRGSLAGAALGFAALALLVAIFGPALALLPVQAVQIVVGALLLLFGLRWLRKAILRAAGIIPLHDEAKTYAQETASLSRLGAAAAAYDPVAVATSFKAVMLEGVEVVFIVVAVSAGGATLAPAIVGAGLALAIVVALGFALRRPVERVPENVLKFVVGVLLTAFGLFWIGEGMGAAWPGGDLSLPALALGLLVVSGFAVALARGLTGLRSI